MSLKFKDYSEVLDREVSKWQGASISYARSKRHHVAVLTVGSASRQYTFPCTGSDRRSVLNAASGVRNILRGLGATKDGR